MDAHILDRLEALITAARTAGADAADAVAVNSQSRSVSWRDGAVEDIDGSEGADIGLRVFVGPRQAMVSAGQHDADAIQDLPERAVAMAKAVPEDAYCGLAERDLLAGSDDMPALDLLDDSIISTDQLKALAIEAEDTARAIEGVTNSDGAGASAGRWAFQLATSDGFTGHYEGSSFSASVSAIAGDGTGMERDYDLTQARHFADLRAASDIGRSAGEKAVRRLNPVKISSGKRSVVFAPRVAKTLLGHLAGAINGNAIARGTSFLKDSMGAQLFDSSVTVIDDPLRPRGLGSHPFDGEGVAALPLSVINNGVLSSWILNSSAGRQLSLPTTGHASRSVSGPPGITTSNFYMAPGSLSPAALIDDIQDGFYVTELIGMGVNLVTGDYSRGAAGYKIEGGEITHAVSEVTIAGNLNEMFKRLVPASDLEWMYAVNAPTIRIDDMMVAGS